MAAMLQQQYVVQETEPRDWAACALSLLSSIIFCAKGFFPCLRQLVI